MNAPSMTAAPGQIIVLDELDFFPALTAAVVAAKQNIVGAQYMVRAARDDDAPIYRQLWTALTAAASRLPVCRILLNDRFPLGLPAKYNRQAAADLAAAGWRVRKHGPFMIAHQKFWLIDDQIIVLGSSNIAHSERPRTTNANLLIHSHTTALRLLNTYNQQWAQAAPYEV